MANVTDVDWINKKWKMQDMEIILQLREKFQMPTLKKKTWINEIRTCLTLMAQKEPRNMFMSLLDLVMDFLKVLILLRKKYCLIKVIHLEDIFRVAMWPSVRKISTFDPALMGKLNCVTSRISSNSGNELFQWAFYDHWFSYLFICVV